MERRKTEQIYKHILVADFSEATRNLETLVLFTFISGFLPAQVSERNV